MAVLLKLFSFTPMSRILSFFLPLIIFNTSLGAQSLTQPSFKQLKQREDSLKSLSLSIIQGRTSEDRFVADSQFTRMFVRALKVPYSIQYPFDSLITISKLAPPDSSFRIYTWHMVINDNVVRQHGAIQMRTKDGSLKLFPLIDKSDLMVKPGDTIASNRDWFGAVYYKIIQKEAFGRKYYTLLGYDENSVKSNKKVVEVLSFYDGEPIFGGSYFSFKTNSLTQNFGKRFIMEYKKNAGPRLTYDADLDMIIFEHMISETGEPSKKWTYVPDGDYEGLKWANGKWVYVEKVFDFKLEQGQEPVPHPLRDAKGNLNEELLKDNTGGLKVEEDEPLQPDPAKTTTPNSQKKPAVKK